MFVESAPSATSDRAVSDRSRSRLDGLPLELIEREIEQLAAQISAGSARWLELVAEFDRRQGWANTGCRSTSEWVAWRCALTPRSAREHVRVARALPKLPMIRRAFAAGELSYSKVRALTRVADAEAEDRLLELARYATASQLERMVRAARRVTAAQADEAHRDSFVRWSWDPDDGSLRIEAKLAPEDGALFLRSLEAARDALFAQRAAEGEEDGRGSAEPQRSESEPVSPTPSPTNAESFVALAETALAGPRTGLAGGERYQVFVHVDAETLATDAPGASLTGPGQCSIGDGPGISPETARRLACDSSLVPVLLSHSSRSDPWGRRGLRPASVRRRAPHRTLGARWGDGPREPAASLPLPPSARPRGSVLGLARLERSKALRTTGRDADSELSPSTSPRARAQPPRRQEALDRDGRGDGRPCVRRRSAGRYGSGGSRS
jgi:Domain of unknown function (DUF222)